MFKSILIIITVILGIAVISLLSRGCNHVNTAVDNAVVNYEEYQEIYNTTQKLNTDLCNIKSIENSDPMFQQFSKAQRINQLKTQLNRWVEEYNAKSKMFNRSIWKSSSLPYQLSVNQFNCY